MKKQCLVCQFVVEDDLHTCPACGQGTWVVLDGDEDVKHIVPKKKTK